jgi:peptidoglycan/xylan/chitin deacetylase (PgdA/CDA1 family)
MASANRRASTRPPLALAYHSIGRLSRHQDPSYLSVAPARFVTQVRYLQRRGWELVSATELARRVRDDRASGACALTFDDGAEDNATVLPELLDELEVPATLFVCEGLLGEPDPFFAPMAGVRFMSADQLQRVAAHPRIEIGSHTSHHAELKQASLEQAREQMLRSKQSLEQLIGREVRAFSYPRCHYSAACPDAAREAGFDAAFTCGSRGRWAPYELPRVIVTSWDRVPTFAARVHGVFDRLWDSAPARLARRVGRRVGLAPPSPPPGPGD